MCDCPAEPNRSQWDRHPLDQVIWRALSGAQRGFAQGDERARRYPAAIAPFAATRDAEPASLRSLLRLLRTEDRVALFSPEEFRLPATFSVVRRDSAEQMVLGVVGAPRPPAATAIETLGTADVPEMLALAAATQPGPFGPRTIVLGRYLGIRRYGALVAMAGERMRFDGFTEISAVCVDPAHRGKGYAADLVLTLAASIAARSETPFLHVFSSNAPAIALYRKLGFVPRRPMHLAVLAPAEGSPDRSTSNPPKE